MLSKLVLLFINFFYIGSFSFGGGYAMMPLIQDVVVKYGWMTNEGFADMIAISQMTPGPIAINMATYVGFTTVGALGSITATIAVCMPALIIISIVMRYIMKYKESNVLNHILQGLKPATIGLIAAAAYKIAIISIFDIEEFMVNYNITKLIDPISLFITVGIMFCIYKYKIHPIIYILAAGVVGMILL